MPRQELQKDEQIIYDSMKAIRGIPQSKIEFMLKKVGGPFAGTFRLSGPWGERYFYIKVVAKLTPALLELVIHQIKTSPAPDNASPLLVSHYISPKLADQLKAKGIEYADCAGNLFLNQMPIYIEINGKKHTPKAPGADKLFRTAGLKLVYLFLRNRKAVNATYRVLAEDAGIALGAIGGLFGELEKRGNLRVENGERQLVAMEELLQRWQLGYLETLRPKLVRQNYRLTENCTISQLPEQLKQLGIGKHLLIGGELAAALMVSGFQPQSAVLYLEQEQQMQLEEKLSLIPDPNGNLTMLKPFGLQNFWSGKHPEGLLLADPLLTFAELQGAGTDQLADKLYRQFLVPRFEP